VQDPAKQSASRRRRRSGRLTPAGSGKSLPSTVTFPRAVRPIGDMTLSDATYRRVENIGEWHDRTHF
jgi:hypothetical protein